MPILGNNYITNNIMRNKYIDSKDALHYLIFNNPDTNKNYIDDSFIPLNHNIYKNVKIKLCNWYVFEYSNIERYIVCKCKTINNKHISLMFKYYHHYLCDETLLNDNKNLQKIKINIDKYKCGKYIELDFKIINNKYNIINHKDLENYDLIYNPEDKENYKKLYLFMTTFKIEISSNFNHNFLDYRWFFLINNIDIIGCYNIDLQKLKKINTKNGDFCMYSDDPKSVFDTKIENFPTELNILSFDIECFHDGVFPTPDKNKISHISFEIYNTNIKKLLVFFSTDNIIDMDSVKENEHIKIYKNLLTIEDCCNILKENYMYIGMSELNILIFIQYILNTDPDYILTYNGHNFDFPYIMGRFKYYNLSALQISNICHLEPLTFLKIRKKNDNTITENNNNSNIIFTDLYAYLKNLITLGKKFASYKLGNISKDLFKSDAYCKWTNNVCEIFPINNKKNSYKLFYKALRTANYCFIDDLPYKIIDKKNIINNFNDLYDEKSFEESINKSFQIIPFHSNKIDKTNKKIIVNISKDDVDIGDKNIYKNYTFKKAIDISKYCIHDTVLCRLIFESESVHNIITAFSALRILPQAKVLFYTSNTDVNGLILQKLLEHRLMIEKNNNLDIVEYEGGKVYHPSKNFIKGPVLIFDFNSLYPTVIIEGNISPEKIVCVLYINDLCLSIKIETIIKKKFPYPNFMMFKIEKKNHINEKYYIYVVTDKRSDGFITILLKHGIDLRNINKKLLKQNEHIQHLKYLYHSLQYANKIYINTIYGLYKYLYFIFSSPLCAELCTGLGRLSLEYVYNIINKSVIDNEIFTINKIRKIYTDTYLNIQYSALNIDNCVLEVVYGDTDSLFINISFKNKSLTNEELIIKSHNIGKYLEKFFIDYKIFDGIYKFCYESNNMCMLLTSKKKYIAHQYDINNINEPLLYNKGVDLVRTDYCRFHKINSQYLITYIINSMKNNNTSNADNKILDFLTTLINENINNINNLNYNDFMLTRNYKGIYKLNDSFNLKDIVDAYNLKNPNNIIKKGERISYIYGTHISDDQLIEPTINKNLLSHVTEQIIIIDNNFKYKNIRISIEIYLQRLINNITKYMNDKKILPELIKKIFNNSKNQYLPNM
jgi:DNA polymerase elongation subunit (family B)